jgi:hypothetical protein
MSLAAWQMRELERKQQHEHFHLGREDRALDAWAEKSSCIICHTVYPHGRNKKAMAIINLHTEFLTCNSCHIKPMEAMTIKFGWVSPPGMKPQGFPFGTRVDPQTGQLAQTDNRASKIAPYYMVSGKLQPFATESGIARALKFMAGKSSYSEEQKKSIVDDLHRETEIKQFILCSQCHSVTGILPFAELGFDKARTNQLQRMEISGMLTNYDVFYFPDLFRNK